MIPDNIRGHAPEDSGIIPPVPVIAKTHYNTKATNTETYIQFPQPLQNNTWSVSFRIKLKHVVAASAIIGDDNSNYYMRVDSLNSRIILRAGDGTQVFFTGLTFNIDTWYQVDVHSDNLSARAFVDNVESPVGALAISATAGTVNQWKTVGIGKNLNPLKGAFSFIGFWQGYVLTNSDRADILAGTKVISEIGVGNHHFAYEMGGEGTETNVLDYSAAGNDGLIKNSDYIEGYASPWVANDLGGSALRFLANKAYSSSINVNANAVSTEIWTMYFRVDGLYTGTLVASPTSARLNIVLSSTTMVVRSGSSSGLTFALPARTAGVFYEIIVTCTALHEHKVYQNAVESVTGPLTQGGQLNGWGSFWFAKGLATTTTSSNIIIDKYLIWYDHVATQQETTDIYNGGVPLDPTTIIANPAAYYDFTPDYGSQRYVKDLSGNKFNLGINEFWNWPEPVWVANTQGEALLVENLMTLPTGTFINALNRYVTSEENTLNDNWDKTNEFSFYGVDSYINAVIPWKGHAYTGGDGFHLFIAVIGFVNDGTDSGIHLSAAFDYGAIAIADNGFIGIVIDGDYFPTGNVDGIGVLFGTAADDGTKYLRKSATGGVMGIHEGQASKTLDNVYLSLKNIWTVFVDEIAVTGHIIRDYNNGVLLGTRDRLMITPLPGGFSEVDIRFTGTHKGWINGKSIDFDRMANYAAQRVLHEEFLIQKHISKVTEILARYTDLTDIEVFAMGRLISQSIENGNWDEIDEIFMFGLFSSANAIIGLKSKTATLNNAPVHSGGLGFLLTGNQTITSNFNSSIDNVAWQLNDALVGIIFRGMTFAIGGRNYLTLANSSINEMTLNNDSLRAMDNRFQTGGVNMRVTSELPSNDSHQAMFRNPNARLIIDGVEKSVYTNTGVDLGTGWLIGRATSNIEANVPTWYIGGGVSLDSDAWFSGVSQCQNEMEIEKSDLVDWNIQNKTYNWTDRFLLPEQLQKLVTIINFNSDNTTTGRILTLVGNLGVTLTAQAQIDDLTTNKNWTVTLI